MRKLIAQLSTTIHKPGLLIAIGLALAATAGGLSAVALGVGTATPSKTVTVNVATGPTGPTGPAGPQGEPGPENCPAGSTFGKLVINHPGGQVSIYTCILD